MSDSHKNETSETNIANMICPSVTDPVKPYIQWLNSVYPLRYLANSSFIPEKYFAPLPSPTTFYCGFYKISVFRYSYLFKRRKNIKHNIITIDKKKGFQGFHTRSDVRPVTHFSFYERYTTKKKNAVENRQARSRFLR